jgi:hypothetical protein
MGCAGGKEKEVSAEFFLHHPNGPAIESALTELAANTQDQKPILKTRSSAQSCSSLSMQQE